MRQHRRWQHGLIRRHGKHGFHGCPFKGAVILGMAVGATVALVSWQAGFVGLRVGEAKNPGPWKIGTANVTSMWTQMDAAASISADVLALQETRLSEAGQKLMTEELDKRGWQCFWGCPQPPQCRQTWSCTPS
eukprot:4163564-Karenia_brevis.AAC.1